MDKLRLNNLDSTIKSSYRTLAIFEFFAEYKKPASVGEISRSLNIPQSSASGILYSLADISYLSYHSETRKFFPTMRMAFLVNWKIDQSSEAAAFSTLLKKLSKSLQENVVLALRSGIYSHYLYVEHFDRSLEKHVEIGSVRPLVTSATGWALLAQEADYEIGKLIRSTEEKIDKKALGCDLGDVRKHINLTRDKGFAHSNRTTTIDNSGIAMALPDNKKTPRLAIAVAGNYRRINSKATEITQALTHALSEVPLNITEEVMASKSF